MISDERREVAETMRVISGEGVSDLTLGEVLNSILTGGAPRPTTEMAILARLADLIDPTCEMVVKNGHACCGKCGHRLAGECEVEEDYYEFRPFCPDCGARVVSD